MTSTTKSNAEKMNSTPCGGSHPEDPLLHRWGSEPEIEIAEVGPVAWWMCQRCLARALHDPESEDGFEPEVIVVFPPSCFEASEDCGCPRRASGDVEHLRGCVDEEAVTEALARRAEHLPISESRPDYW